MLPDDMLHDRMTRLNGERTATANLLNVLAHDLGLDNEVRRASDAKPASIGSARQPTTTGSGRPSRR